MDWRLVLIAVFWALPGIVKGVTLPVTAGLQLWLAADSVDPGDPSQVTVVNGVTYVKAWRDKSSGHFDATQAAADRQPSYVTNAANGNPVLKFDGLNDCLATSLPQLPGNKSIFIVHKRINASSPSGTELSTTSAGAGMFFGNNGASETQGRIAIAHDLQAAGLLNDYVLKGYVRSGAASTLYVNDAVVTGSAADAASGFYTVSDQNNFPYSGAIAEILIYNRAVTELERQAIENYLAERWALWTISLPVRNGLELWLASDGINIFEPTQVSQRNGNYYLNRWQGRNYSARNAYQATAAYQPAVILNGLNNRPVVRFDGVNDVLTTALLQIAGNKSIFTVHKRTGTGLGLEVSSTANGTNMFMGNNAGTSETKGRFSNGRTSRAFDLQVPGLPNQFVLKKYTRNGTLERLQVNDATASANVSYDFSNGYYSISDGLGSPFAGDIAEVLIYNRAVSDPESTTILNYLQNKWSWTPDNVFTVGNDLQPPAMTVATPAPGLRVKQTVPAYAGTNAYHTLYLPTDWQPGRKYPVIVEYAPNGVFSDSYGDYSSGNVEDMSLGYGIAGPAGYIIVGMPTLGGNPLTNQTTWWGNVGATKDYCLQTVRYICEQFGGDPSAVMIAGFSRGSIACNYLGLNDDTIADVWLGFIPHAHYDGQYQWGYGDDDPASAYTRLLRLKGRFQHISNEKVLVSAEAYLTGTGINMAPFRFRTLPFANHTDQWTLRPLQLRKDTRAWLQQTLQDRPGTHSISGRATSSTGTPLAGVRIQSGYTHFTFTAADGTYTLAGLIDSVRTVAASGGGTFTDQAVTVAGSNVPNVNFQALP